MTTALLVLLVVLNLTLLVMVRRTGRDAGKRAPSAAAPTSTEVEEPARDDLLESLAEHIDARCGEVQARLGEIRSSLEDLAVLAREARESAPKPLRVAEVVQPLIREAVDSLDGRLRELSGLLAPSLEEDSAAAVVRSLREQGFEEILVLEVPQDVEEGLRIGVEARREGMTYKGHVFLVGGRVVDTRLSPSHLMFP